MTDKAKPPIAAGAAPSALIPQSIDEAWRISQILSSAGEMCPKDYRGKPEATMAAIMRGLEVGLSPTQSLNFISVVNGRASVHSEALQALALRAGHQLDAMLEGQGDKRRAVAVLIRRDSGQKFVRSFSMAQAKQAGLLSKQGPWSQYPDRMLMNRARGYAIRDGAPDALLGLDPAPVDQIPGMRDVTPSAPDLDHIPGELTRTNLDPGTGEPFIDPETGEVIE